MTLFIGLQNATGSDLKGVVASRVPAVADFQSRLLGLETKARNIDRRTMDMQASLQKIENKINSDPRAVENSNQYDKALCRELLGKKKEM